MIGPGCRQASAAGGKGGRVGVVGSLWRPLLNHVPVDGGWPLRPPRLPRAATRHRGVPVHRSSRRGVLRGARATTLVRLISRHGPRVADFSRTSIPTIRAPAPHFSGTAVVDGQFKDIALSDYAGKWVVLFFYPLDFTFV